MTLIVRPGYGGAAVSDPDAQTYLQAVEVADNQALEQGVQQAVNQFVIGCKADGIWTAIKASCILAGARTLTGALVPLTGTAPTPVAFVSGDYNRKTGLVGGESTKYLNSNRANNADPQNSNHNAVWLSTYTSGDQYLLGSGATTGHNFLLARTDAAFFRSRFNTSTNESLPATGSQFSGGLFGMSRTSDITVNVTYKQNTGQVFTSRVITSSVPTDTSIEVFKTSSTYSNSRLAFYSIGESLNLALLDARVSALITAFGVAIP
jgi:hypothetical protein